MGERVTFLVLTRLRKKRPGQGQLKINYQVQALTTLAPNSIGRFAEDASLFKESPSRRLVLDSVDM